MSSDAPLRIGDVLYGFCAGYFGRDSYDDKRVEAIGSDWVVVRNDSGGVEMYDGDPETLREFRTNPVSLGSGDSDA